MDSEFLLNHRSAHSFNGHLTQTGLEKTFCAAEKRYAYFGASEKMGRHPPISQSSGDSSSPCQSSPVPSHSHSHSRQPGCEFTYTHTHTRSLSLSRFVFFRFFLSLSLSLSLSRARSLSAFLPELRIEVYSSSSSSR